MTNPEQHQFDFDDELTDGSRGQDQVAQPEKPANKDEEDDTPPGYYRHDGRLVRDPSGSRN